MFTTVYVVSRRTSPEATQWSHQCKKTVVVWVGSDFRHILASIRPICSLYKNLYSFEFVPLHAMISNLFLKLFTVFKFCSLYSYQTVQNIFQLFTALLLKQSCLVCWKTFASEGFVIVRRISLSAVTLSNTRIDMKVWSRMFTMNVNAFLHSVWIGTSSNSSLWLQTVLLFPLHSYW